MATTKTATESEQVRAFRKAAADPVRLKVMRRVQYPEGGLTAAQIAEQLGVAANGLYYHLGVLETAGVMEVVGMERRGRTTERKYAPVAQEPIGNWDIAEPEEIVNVFLGVLELAKADARDAVYAYAQAHEDQAVDGREMPYFEGHEWKTTREELSEFRSQVRTLITTFRERAASLRSTASEESQPEWVTLCFPHGVWEREAPQTCVTKLKDLRR